MKKLISLTAVPFLVTFLFSSCQKEGITITKVVNVEITANETYSYLIPRDDDEDDATRTTQITYGGVPFSESEITESGSTIVFNYTPAPDYVGSDEVKVSDTYQEESHCGNGRGNSSEANVTVYDFKITVKEKTK